MAFLPGIFGRGNTPAPAAPAPMAAPQPANTPPINMNQNPTGQPASMQQAPANPGANPQAMIDGSNAAVNPLDNFANMFKPKPVDPNAPKAPTLQDPLLGPLDPSAFRQQIAQANFASGIPQETLQKALSGDAQAFTEAINSAAREAFAAAAQLSHGLVEHGARTAAERVNGSLDSRIRNFQIKSQNTSHEALSHPAVAPMLGAVKMQIAQSNPQLSPEAVQQQAEQYFTQMAEVLTAPKRAAAQAASAPKETDFSSYLN
ncbi:MAG: hypothetical protein ACO22U_13895 [bacterium]